MKTVSQLPTHLPETGFIRWSQLKHLVGFSSSTARRKMMDGTFPRSIQLSSHMTVWKVEDVRKWINSPT